MVLGGVTFAELLIQDVEQHCLNVGERAARQAGDAAEPAAIGLVEGCALAEALQDAGASGVDSIIAGAVLVTRGQVVRVEALQPFCKPLRRPRERGEPMRKVRRAAGEKRARVIQVALREIATERKIGVVVFRIHQDVEPLTLGSAATHRRCRRGRWWVHSKEREDGTSKRKRSQEGAAKEW